MGSRGRPRLFAGFVVVLCSVLSLAACALPGVEASSDATTILQKVQQIQLKDASFDLAFTGSLSSEIGGSSGSVSGAGSGKLTTAPRRVQMALSFGGGGQGLPVEAIFDGDAHDVYVTIPGLSAVAGQSWIKLSLGNGSSFGGINASDFDISQILDFTQLANVSLAGKETLNGVPVYHLKGGDTATGKIATADLYVRQDNYSPLRAILHVSLFITGNLTLDFTAINDGTTITLPPAGQIINQ